MAYTQQQINDIYQQERAAGKSDADLQRVGATQYGLTADQMSAAVKAYTPAAPAAPAATGMLSAGATPVATAAPQVGRFTQEQYDGARQWSDGKSAKEILSKAAELRLTPDELGKVFGNHGGSWQQVKDATQYDATNRTVGSNTSGTVVPWGTSKSRALDDWRYDLGSTNGWVYNKGSGGGASGDINFEPNLNRQINAAQETIEGRLNGLLITDAQGNYTNPVVRQAVDRAMQQMAGRGLLNSSMASQAAQEAAIAKAIEIVGPDAERYFQQGRANQDAQNVFARDEQANKYDLGKMAVGHGYDMEKLAAGQKNDLEKMAQQYGWDLSKLSAQQRNDLEKLAINNQYAVEAKDKEYAFTGTQADLDRQNRLAAAGISASRPPEDQSWRMELTRLEQQGRQGDARAQVVSNAYGKLMDQAMQITGDMNMDASAKANLLNQQAGIFNNIAEANGSTLRAPSFSTDKPAAPPSPAGMLASGSNNDGGGG